MNARSDHSTVHQRTQLFGPEFSKPVERSRSPFNNGSHQNNSNNNINGSLDYSQSMLAQLESQSDAEVGIMSEKLKALKNLSLRMGEEIRGSSHTLDELGNTFEQGSVKLKRTFNKMMIMAKKSKISIKTWLLIFFSVGVLFFYVWIR
ncbi:Bet1p Ecym_4492 [Eremothecium cymbalariae DBVPG|uniref:t-SNARE coiled-coil homology domain-containing protein n=1 Tax=Eremothecium cymbalariae (strain CBS 270.75 / DBVPG 7215 / KCTC 17166 / NRRL Y-17582) TaxID=931890 RepID=G8JU28_ERECY|nr:hypothetical protein Ecym_4492 [Eremothecium cymbalariae DBVPG\